jgi:hypothetical protein
MAALKPFTTSDITVVPFIVNKSFTFVGSSSFEEFNVGIDRLIGTYIPNSSPFTETTEPTTGNIGTYYQRDIYSSIKQLYYTNYIPNPLSGSLLTYEVGGVAGFNVLTEDYTTSNVYSRFYNYESTTLSQSRYFPTESGAQIGVISIPSKLFGEYIAPNSFNFSLQQYPNFPDAFLSASLTTTTLIKDDNNTLSITDSNPYITWVENTDSLGLFNGGQLTISNDISFPTNLYIEVTASNPISATDITILVCTGSNYTDSISTHTFPSFPGNYEFVVSLDKTYVGNGQTISLFPLFNNSDPSNASIDLDIKMRMYKKPPFKIKDNGEGAIYISGSSDYVGIINYSHGTVIITSNDIIPDFTSSSDITCSFQSSRTIYETQYRCTLKENEFNFSLNPSLISGSGFTNPLNTTCSVDQRGITYNFVTESCFTPYVASVGLYNERQELLAVAKLAQPLPTSRTTDMTIVVNLDMF